MNFIRRAFPILVLGFISTACGASNLFGNSTPEITPSVEVEYSSPVATATDVPLPTQTDTPPPSTHFEKAEQALFFGDWDTALS